MSTLNQYDLANSIIVGNAHFLAKEFMNGQLHTKSETIKNAFQEIMEMIKVKNAEIMKMKERMKA